MVRRREEGEGRGSAGAAAGRGDRRGCDRAGAGVSAGADGPSGDGVRGEPPNRPDRGDRGRDAGVVAGVVHDRSGRHCRVLHRDLRCEGVPDGLSRGVAAGGREPCRNSAGRAERRRASPAGRPLRRRRAGGARSGVSECGTDRAGPGDSAPGRGPRHRAARRPARQGACRRTVGGADAGRSGGGSDHDGMGKAADQHHREPADRADRPACRGDPRPRDQRHRPAHHGRGRPGRRGRGRGPYARRRLGRAGVAAECARRRHDIDAAGPARRPAA